VDLKTNCCSFGEKTELIEQKNRENEALLLNILPGEIANRLKHGENEIADNFADVTVLFGDLVGFTVLSSETAATEIVDRLNGLFSRFDRAANELGIEKIKTIGDCTWLCADYPDAVPTMPKEWLAWPSEWRQLLESMEGRKTGTCRYASGSTRALW
jgi:class 3 adenylate cyclase